LITQGAEKPEKGTNKEIFHKDKKGDQVFQRRGKGKRKGKKELKEGLDTRAKRRRNLVTLRISSGAKLEGEKKGGKGGGKKVCLTWHLLSEKERS